MLGLFSTIIAGAIGYGRLEAQVAAVEKRIEKLEANNESADERTRRVDRKLIRICARLKVNCRDEED